MAKKPRKKASTLTQTLFACVALAACLVLLACGKAGVVSLAEMERLYTQWEAAGGGIEEVGESATKHRDAAKAFAHLMTAPPDKPTAVTVGQVTARDRGREASLVRVSNHARERVRAWAESNQTIGLDPQTGRWGVVKPLEGP
jgi:hypothetical protein